MYVYISTNANKILKYMYTGTNLYIFISQIVTIIIIIIYITHLFIVLILHIYKLMQTKYISLIYVCVFYSYDYTFFYFSTYPKL